jgi:hypothetical protein
MPAAAWEAKSLKPMSMDILFEKYILHLSRVFRHFKYLELKELE